MVAVAERARRTWSATASTRCAELVEIANTDPRRGIGHEKVLTRIKIDDAPRRW